VVAAVKCLMSFHCKYIFCVNVDSVVLFESKLDSCKHFLSLESCIINSGVLVRVCVMDMKFTLVCTHFVFAVCHLSSTVIHVTMPGVQMDWIMPLHRQVL